MTKMSTKHDLSFKKDPMQDRQAMIGEMKGFGGKFPTNPFKAGKPQTDTDSFYAPFPGKEKK